MSLLDLSKLESGTMSMKKGTVAVGQLLSDVAATLAPKARKRSIEIECTVEAGLPDVQGDPDRLRQVFVNLVDNAVKFSSEGGRISISARRRPESVEVRISDQGVGIPRADQQRIFSKFYRAESPGPGVHGTGLGLFLARGLLLAMGGKIWVESREGQGSTFVLELPAGASGAVSAAPEKVTA